MIDKRLGHYEITDLLGKGGMGQVFLAHDSRLQRDVALKVLPESFAQDPMRMARFEREARLLASLNHPNIATLHGIEDFEGRKALVMEYVPGEDLAKRTQGHALALPEALRIAIAIARALEAAHARGVVHRDLKPANVVVRPDDEVKVLDFGLAKSVEQEPESGVNLAESPTLSIHATQMGMVLGTAAYMSPEQARGRVVDARSDIFSFGCTLFEMLAGEPAFAGEDVSEIFASVIKSDVRWDRLPADLPAPVRRVLERCLKPRVDERYQAIGDVRYDLVGFLENPSSLEVEATPASRGGIPRALAAALVVAALLIGAFGASRLRPAPVTSDSPVVTFALDVDDPESAAISPDGSRVAYSDADGIWLRRLDRLEPRRLDLDEPFAVATWARDGRTLVVSTRDELWKIDVDAGGVQKLVEFPVDDGGFIWGASPLDDAEILVGRARVGIFAVSLTSGSRRLLLADDGEPGAEGSVGTTSPIALPDGAGILFANQSQGVIEAVRGTGHEVVFEIPDSRITDPVYAPSGHLLFRLTSGLRARALWAVPFSPATLRATGEPFQVAPFSNASISDNGVLLVRTTPRRPPSRRRLVWVSREGSVLRQIGEPLIDAYSPVLSPEDNRAAVAARETGDGSYDITLVDLRTGVTQTFRDDVGSDLPQWWQDDGSIGYTMWSSGIRQARIRGTSGDEAPRDLGLAAMASGSRDGRYFFGSFRNLYYVDREDGQRHVLIDDGEFHEARLSPDGHWLAYGMEQGLFVASFPDWGRRIPVTAGQVDAFRWSRDGTELIYRQGPRMLSVTFDGSKGDPVVGDPALLFEETPTEPAFRSEFDVARDGRFLMVQELEAEAQDETEPPRLLVTTNWAQEFRASTGRK